MSFLDLVRFAAGNLWRRRTRTLLTVLGVFIGTACITLMVALSLGNLEQFNESIMQDSNLTRVEVYSEGGPGSPRLDQAAVDSFRALPGVRMAAGMTSMPAYIKMGKYEYSGSVTVADLEALGLDYAAGGPYPDSSAIELVVGSNAREYFQDPRQREGSFSGGMVSVVAYDSGEQAEEVGPDVDWLEEKILYYPSWGNFAEEETTPDRPAPKEYRGRICGLLAPSYNQESYSVFMSPEAAARVFRENRKRLQSDGVQLDAYEQAYIDAADVDDVQSILEAVRDLGFQAYSDTQWISSMQEEQRRQQAQLVAIGMISLIVSAIGIANTMLASILERRREIGVMKVIGLSVQKINLMFLVEAAMIGLIGGVIGIGISYVLAAAVSSGAGPVQIFGMYFDQGVYMVIPWWLSLGAVGVAAAVGIISGLYPAWKATRMSPLEAIRGQI